MSPLTPVLPCGLCLLRFGVLCTTSPHRVDMNVFLCLKKKQNTQNNINKNIKKNTENCPQLIILLPFGPKLHFMSGYANLMLSN